MHIFNEDCLSTMAKMLTGSVDIVITSPPYNMNLRIRNGEYCSRQIIPEISTKYKSFPDNLPIDEFYEIHKDILTELMRVSNRVFYVIKIVTGSKRSFFNLIGEFSKKLKEIIIWDKCNAQPAIKEQVLNRQFEMILVFESNNAISRRFIDAPFLRGELNDVWHIPREYKKSTGHGAVFPEQLVEKILVNFSNEGDTVYDPFMGTGTTAVVAKRLRRKYIGSEISKDYCDIISDRINQQLV